MKIRKNDTVIVVRGKDRGKVAKIVQVIPQESRVVVDGVNIKKRHQRPRRAGEKGQILEIAAPVAVSSVKLLCPKCGKATRVGYYATEKEKVRICKKCKEELS